MTSTSWRDKIWQFYYLLETMTKSRLPSIVFFNVSAFRRSPSLLYCSPLPLPFAGLSATWLRFTTVWAGRRRDHSREPEIKQSLTTGRVCSEILIYTVATRTTRLQETVSKRSLSADRLFCSLSMTMRTYPTLSGRTIFSHFFRSMRVGRYSSSIVSRTDSRWSRPTVRRT